MSKSRTISGIFVTLFGIFLIILSFTIEELSVLLGLFFVSFGVIIFFNRAEDEIEQIKVKRDKLKNKVKSKLNKSKRKKK